VCLSELAISFGLAAHLTAQLLQVPDDVRKQFDATMRTLVGALPAIDIMNINKLLAELNQRDRNVTDPH
jgi:hypothetical protein